MRRSGTAGGFERLRRRTEFQAVARGTRLATPAFTVQARARGESDVASPGPRFGLTLTKKTAPRAVDRNRMRRRLREALRLGAALSGRPGHDYVIVGRELLLTIGFADLRDTLTSAIAGAGRDRASRANRHRAP